MPLEDGGGRPTSSDWLISQRCSRYVVRHPLPRDLGHLMPTFEPLLPPARTHGIPRDELVGTVPPPEPRIRNVSHWMTALDARPAEVLCLFGPRGSASTCAPVPHTAPHR